MPSGCYLMDLQCTDIPACVAADTASTILDAIAAAGPTGADIETLVGKTHYTDTFLRLVLRDLRATGMTWATADLRYRVTPLGETARRLAGH